MRLSTGLSKLRPVDKRIISSVLSPKIKEKPVFVRLFPYYLGLSPGVQSEISIRERGRNCKSDVCVKPKKPIYQERTNTPRKEASGD